MEGLIAYDVSRVSGPLANAFVLMLNSLFINVKLVGDPNNYPPDYAADLLNENNPIFDFIVVGGGTSGCTLARHISETRDWTVLLIEAGDYPSASTEVPGFYINFAHSNEDWQFKFEKDPKVCQATVDGTCTFTRGKVLGGTSTINNMHYVRGFPDDFDKIHIPYWNSNLTQMIHGALENFKGIGTQYTYGQNGHILLGKFNYQNQIKNVLQTIYNLTDHSKIPRRKYIGYLDQLVYSRNGERINMAKMFLSNIKDRSNLFVTLNTHVQSIVIGESYDKRAKGVNVTLNSIDFTIRAKKEVILTAGAINNAKLLLVSGVGPADYLRKRNIAPTSINDNVGKNLQFHLGLPLFFSIDACAGPVDCQLDKFYIEDYIADIFNYIMNRSGNLTNTNLNDFVLYVNTKKMGVSQPNLSVLHKYFKVDDISLETVIRSLNYKPAILKSLLKLNKDTDILMATLTLLNPESRGEVLLNDTHFQSKPIIKSNFLSDDEHRDYNSLLSGFIYLTNLTEHKYMKQHHFQFLNVDIPNCRNHKFCTTQYVQCYITNMAYPVSDAAGTTRMGASCQPDAVVYNDLQVRGVRCLRVGDSSVLPYIVSGNTVATDAMIAYRLGEIIREKWIKDYVSPFPFEHEEDYEID